MVAVATLIAFGCKKEETFTLPGTSWAFDMEASLYGTTVIFNDTLNIIDDHTLNRAFHFEAAGKVLAKQEPCNYTWDGTHLTLLDSVGEPTNMVLTYRDSNNVFFRDISSDEEMSALFRMMGISEVTYKQIK